MALDRHSIEKKDFPLGQRGYDPAAVDAHLASVADEIDTFKQDTRRRSDTVAASASERVRTIVEAAEQSAAEIQRAAEQDAREIREDAGNEAVATRENASREASEYLERVSASTNAMLERLTAMEGEIHAMIETVRTGSNRLRADLQRLQDGVDSVSGSLSPRPGFRPEEVSPESAELRSVAGETSHGNGGDQPEPVPQGADVEGARLIALNMALNGTPREEAARYLTENFQLPDAGVLLDEVYASVEG
ncbi:MAG: DivIVA domain-containing protein [Solirubrobacteraceae bacterium]